MAMWGNGTEAATLMAKAANFFGRPLAVVSTALLLTLAACAGESETATEVTQYPGRQLANNPAPRPPPRKPAPRAPVMSPDEESSESSEVPPVTATETAPEPTAGPPMG